MDGAPSARQGNMVDVQGTMGSINMYAHAEGEVADTGKGTDSIRGRWKRLCREEQVERVVVQGVCAKHVKFGVPTPPNSGNDMSSHKGAFTAILESIAGSKRCHLDDQNLVLSMDSTGSESLEYKSANDLSVSCKRVCTERVEAVVGLHGSIVHVTQEREGREEDAHDRRWESVGEEKEDGEKKRKLPALGLPVT